MAFAKLDELKQGLMMQKAHFTYEQQVAYYFLVKEYQIKPLLMMHYELVADCSNFDCVGDHPQLLAVKANLHWLKHKHYY